MRWENRFSRDAVAVDASEIRELLKVLADPRIVSFAGGIPDPALFPMAEMKKIISALENDPDFNRQAMQYSPTEGYLPLRNWIAARHLTPQISLATENILVTNGAQQSLTLLAATLIDSGDAVAVARPTYLGALQVFGARRPRYLTIATDEDGLVPASVERAFKQGCKFLYTIPDFQNPGGMTIPEDRRRRIVELAHRHDVPIIEDTAYRDLYYDTWPPPSLLEIEGQLLGEDRWQDEGLVMQLGTASKTMMPALRVGWTIAARSLIEKLVLLKQANDLHTSTFNQIIAHELAVNVLDQHVEKLREVYGQRRDAMVAALQKYLPNSTRFTVPGGGMFVWLTLPEGLDAKILLEKALTEAGLAFVPGASFHADRVGGGGENTVRLSFSTNSPDVIEDGMKKLSALIHRESSFVLT
jgi:DNA-binding transcriptional MocR family regulator